ncbi:cycloisomerase 2 family protein [Schizosaccharomyces cryophilus OY26]|uniref:Cycloisomerase 2 family protein n=1 Tax=Schizosaccharomyces cryophilus (strain OY26 / ATCC MYA-4695 / CBS 11777 / NBRC 106824 / NRRL Y48691) TaxID=653667 RepID=S9X771_SCHCR|nr:cycloisomerase 2 family protein [Schizosaccharomyces cryophilus OY26]EPY49621.1 cycloisomerase 2 family protein [Schizosaccharomyces cryophilus OY26]
MKLVIGTVAEAPVLVYDLLKKEVSERLSGVSSPTWIEWENTNKRLYIANEVENGFVSVFEWDSDKFTKVDEFSVEGHSPTSLCVLENGTVLTANYGSASINVSAPGHEKPHVWYHEGKSVHPERQRKSHPHQVMKHEHYVFSVDLGLDRVAVFNAETTSKDPIAVLKVPSGYGPRHAVIHRTLPILYVICELSNRICVFDTKTFQCIQDVSILPKNVTLDQDPQFPQPPSAAEIAVVYDGPFLVASNRYLGNHATDTLWTASLDPHTGRVLEGTDSHIMLQGRCPRHFMFNKDASLLAVAMQDEDLVQVYEREPKTMNLHLLFTIPTPKPTCALFIEDEDLGTK